MTPLDPAQLAAHDGVPLLADELAARAQTARTEDPRRTEERRDG